MSNCQRLSFSQRTRIEAVEFWAVNTYQHIEVLLRSAEGAGATLHPIFQQCLEALFKIFQRIAKDIKEGPASNYPALTREFLQKNRQLICLMERLKFEGYNGYPMLYEVVLHFIYEAKYANDIIQGVNPMPLLGPHSVLYHIKFREMGLGHTLCECIYGQMYFWSLIGAQHPSIIMNVTPMEKSQLPKKTVEKFEYFITEFNDINFELSSLYPKLSKGGLIEIYGMYERTYVEFLNFLLEFKNSDELLPQCLRETLPPIFFGVLGHIIDEAEDAIAIGEKIQYYLG